MKGAHPRGCGADLEVEGVSMLSLGSSPRVRGRRRRGGESGRPSRLIPAGAGQTRTLATAQMTDRAHPRGCGADSSCSATNSNCSGSSPRVRGRLLSHAYCVQAVGLIPAGAGQTGGGRRCAVRARAHPRGCGADPLAPPISKFTPGSSPRVRGRHALLHLTQRVNRLIPAGAGQTVP